MEKKSQKILFWLVVLTFLTPLIYSSHLTYSFQGAKAFYFQILIELAAPFYFYLLFANPNLRPQLKNPLTISVFVYLGASIVSAIFGVNFNQSFFGIPMRGTGILNFTHFVLFYFYLLLLWQIDSKFEKRAQYLLIIVATLISLQAIWEQLGLPKLFTGSFWSDRSSGLLGNPITLAAYLIIPLFFTILRAVTENRKAYKVSFWLIALVELVTIYLTKTRAVFIALYGGFFVSGVLFLIFTQREKIKSLRKYIFAAIILITVAGSFVVAPKLRLNDNDSLSRIIEWKIALKGFGQHPMLGVGPENYSVIADKYFTPELYKYVAGWFDKPHNYLLEILATVGALGLLAYLAMLLVAVGSLYRTFKYGKTSVLTFSVLIGAIVAYITQDLFSFDTPSSLFTFFLLLAVINFQMQQVQNYGEKSSKLGRYAKFAFGLVSIIAICVVYFANLLPIKANELALRATNEKNVKLAVRALDTKTTTPELADTASIIGDLAKTALSDKNLSTEDKEKLFSISTDALVRVTKKVPDNPRYWFKLAEVSYSAANLAQKSHKDYHPYLDSSGEAIKHALALVPTRIEFLLMSAEVNVTRNDLNASDDDLEKVFSYIPNNLDSDWHTKNTSKQDTLIVLDSVIKIYKNKKELARVINIYKGELKIDPYDPGIYLNLALTYAENGDTDNAKIAANKGLELNPKPDIKQELENILLLVNKF